MRRKMVLDEQCHSAVLGGRLCTHTAVCMRCEWSGSGITHVCMCWAMQLMLALWGRPGYVRP